MLYSWLEGKSVAGKAQPTETTAAMRRLSRKVDSRSWESFTQSGLKLPFKWYLLPQTSSGKSYSCCISNIKFQITENLAFHLQMKDQDSEGRAKWQGTKGVWSSGSSFCSLWWFSVPFHLLVFIHLVLSSPKSM